jgi:hypothetical protein
MTHVTCSVLKTIKEKGSKNGKITVTYWAVLQPNNPCFLNFSIIHWKLKEIAKNSTENIRYVFLFQCHKEHFVYKTENSSTVLPDLSSDISVDQLGTFR